MKNNSSAANRKGLIRAYAIFGLVLAAAVVVLLIFPERTQPAVRSSWAYLKEMILILPAVMIIMGLFNVYVSKEQVVRWLGESSGIKGLFLSLLLGSLPTGPLYIAFPIAAALLKKGARVSNIVVFLSAWACIKIPQELVELQFLGAKFMALRLGLTVAFVLLMGIFIEKLSTTSRGTGQKCLL